MRDETMATRQTVSAFLSIAMGTPTMTVEDAVYDTANYLRVSRDEVRLSLTPTDALGPAPSTSGAADA